MEDLSLFQWLVLGMLVVIALLILGFAFVFERDLQVVTEQIARVLYSIDSQVSEINEIKQREELDRIARSSL